MGTIEEGLEVEVGNEYTEENPSNDDNKASVESSNETKSEENWELWRKSFKLLLESSSDLDYTFRIRRCKEKEEEEETEKTESDGNSNEATDTPARVGSNKHLVGPPITLEDLQDDSKAKIDFEKLVIEKIDTKNSTIESGVFKVLDYGLAFQGPFDPFSRLRPQIKDNKDFSVIIFSSKDAADNYFDKMMKFYDSLTVSDESKHSKSKIKCFEVPSSSSSVKISKDFLDKTYEILDDNYDVLAMNQTLRRVTIPHRNSISTSMKPYSSRDSNSSDFSVGSPTNILAGGGVSTPRR